MKTALVVIVLVMATIVAAVFVVGPRLEAMTSKFGGDSGPTEVRLMTVASAPLVETISAPGLVEPKTKVDVSSEVSSRVIELLYEEGDIVSRDDVVARLDDTDLKAALEAAQAQKVGEEGRLNEAQARLTGLMSNQRFAQRQLERKQSLFDSGDISSRELDEALERVEDIEASIESSKFSITVIESSMDRADADIQRAEEALSKTEIVAPMDGVITALNIEVGEVVLGTVNNPGTIVLTVADLSRMIVKAEVAETDIARILEGQEATVHIIAYRDDEFAGTVTHIGLQRLVSTNGTGYFETEVEIDLRGREIRSGLAANVDIEVGRHEGLVIEDQAIRDFPVEDLPGGVRANDPLVDTTRKTTEVVFVMRDGKAVITPVRSGPSDLTRTLINDGLEPGDKVIVGTFKALEGLEPDDAVKEIREDDAKGDAAADDGDAP